MNAVTEPVPLSVQTALMYVPRTTQVLPLLLALFLGCSDGPRGGPRIETHPITGVVTVDGQPAQNLLVRCHPVEGSDISTNISGFTGPDGSFSIGTYESGDGAPEGSYALTFQWGQWSMSGRYEEEDDRLKGKYADPETSDWTAVVVAGLPTNMGTIELTSADDEK